MLQLPAPTGMVPALWVSTFPRNESDALVRFLGSDGAFTASAKGLLKPASKLAPRLKPGDELLLELVRGRTNLAVLAGVSRQRAHPVWQRGLDHTALCWYITECAYISGGDPELNAALYQLVVNIIRSEPAAEQLPSALGVFCLRLLSLHGVLLSLNHCSLTGEPLGQGEVAHLLPSGEGLVGRQAFNEHYARTGGGMPRLDAEQLRRWRTLARSPLLDYPAIVLEPVDCTLLLSIVERQIIQPAGQQVSSGGFLRQQWKLPAWPEVYGQHSR
jgi:DNA repair protein RecO